MYSFIIGCLVNNLDDIPEGFVSTVISESVYEVFQSETGKPEKIVETGTKIWELSEKNASKDISFPYQTILN